MTRERATRLAQKWASGGVCTLKDGEAQEYHKLALSALMEQPRWISVEERLPENEKPVLAYYGFDNDGDGDLGMMFIGTLSYFCFDHDPHWQHADWNLVVTHWMPLPEPPEVDTP